MRGKTLKQSIGKQPVESDVNVTNTNVEEQFNTMMENISVLREAIMDLGGEFDSNNTEINKLKLSEQRMSSRMSEIQSKFDYIRAKMETKLFSGMSEGNDSPARSVTKSPVSMSPLAVKGLL